MKDLKLIISLLLISGTVFIQAQNVVGYKREEILQFMKERHKEMVFETFTNNSSYKYLKYTDSDNTKTMLFFLDPDSVCKAVRVVYDRSFRDDKVKELDRLYYRKGDKAWVESKNGKEYMIEITDEDWSFDITIRQIE